MIKSTLKIILILITGIVAGTLLLMGSFLLPAEVIEKNIKKSDNIFVNESTYETVFPDYASTQIDNFTDSLMLQNASYIGDESIVDKSMNIYRYLNDSDARISLLFQLRHKNVEVSSYDRYWHGYLVILKPMLMILNYNDLRILNSTLQIMLVITVVYLLVKNNEAKYLLSYIPSLIIISPATIAKSLQLSVVFYIFNISMIIMLLYNNKLIKKNRYIYFFFIVGMVTSYFDLLTYPLVTLCMPLILYLILNPMKFSKGIKNIIGLSIIWVIGYAGMWIGKLAVGSILLNRNLFTVALISVNVRTSLEVLGEKITIMSVLKANIENILIKPYILLTQLSVVYVIERLITNKLIFIKNKLKDYLPLLFISLIPFVWYIILSNHSYVHSWFTYRNLMITIFALLSLLISALEKVDNKLDR